MSRTGEITNILLDFKSRIDNQLTQYKNEVVENNTTYSTTVADTRNNQARREYLEYRENVKNIYIKTLNNAIDKIIAKEKEKVLNPLSESDSTYLQGVTHSENVSLAEFKAMAEKYKENYSAVKMLETVAKNNGIEFYFTQLDAKLNRAEDVRQCALGTINKYGAPDDFPDLKDGMMFDGILEGDMDIVTGPYITGTDFKKA